MASVRSASDCLQASWILLERLPISDRHPPEENELSLSEGVNAKSGAYHFLEAHSDDHDGDIPISRVRHRALMAVVELVYGRISDTC
jgi:hypothetical protein